MGKIGNSNGASSVAFDLGILYKREIKDWEGAGWSVGIHASNLGPKIKYLTSKEALPAMVKVGGAADLPFAFNARLTLTADLGYRLSPDDVQALNVSAGAEYAWMEHLMLRGGYIMVIRIKEMPVMLRPGQEWNMQVCIWILRGCLRDMNVLPEIRFGFL